MSTEVNDVFPHAGGYCRPDRADDYQPTRVASRAATTSGTVVEQAHATMVHATTEFEKHMKDLERQKYSAEGLHAQIGMFADTDTARAVNKAVELVKRRREQAQAHVDKLRRDLVPSGDTASELRATRFWNRTKAVLDTLNTPGDLLRSAQDLIANAPPAELGTLLQELGPYFVSRGHTTEWIDLTLAEAVPEYACAREQLKRADQALQIVRYSAGKLNKAFKDGRSPRVLPDPRGRYDPDS